MRDARRSQGTYIFTGERSAQGYAINRMASSLARPGNRAAFRADESAYMAGFGLDATEQDMIRRRDWGALVRHGGSIYLLVKVAATVGSSLLAMGAQMRGETLEQFLASRSGAHPHREDG